MKRTILAVLCLTLTAAVGLAKDYPVLDKDVHLVVRSIADGSAAETSPLYVLLLPHHNPVIFKTFDSKDMEGVIQVWLASGSILHFDPDPLLKQPTDAQIQSLTVFCKKLGITLIVSLTE
jgi:hypothetical protein